MQSLEDRERVPKIQGLINECMTFLDDELSAITGQYDDLLSIEDVIDQELILFVSLNANKNIEPVRSLGKMLLQNIQLTVGKRYEDQADRRRQNRPLFSVVLDEFAPFGYRNFAQILQTARGTNTAFLFSMQSLPQLMQVGRGFKEEVTSAPNTTITLRTWDEETAKYFIKASAEQVVTRRSIQKERGFFGLGKYEETGRATENEDRETRSQDESIKNLPKGQMEILMSDDTRGTLHSILQVRPPEEVAIPDFVPVLYPRLVHSRSESSGAHLRFKNPELARKVPRTKSLCGRYASMKANALLLLATMSVLVYAQAEPGQKPATGLYQRQPGTHLYQQKDDFFHASTKLVNPKDVDYGAVLEQRRKALLDASVTNPFFWYSALTTGLLIVLMVAYGVRVMDEKRKLWRAAEIPTDVWTVPSSPASWQNLQTRNSTITCTSATASWSRR
jgi:hypothetical protein